MPYADSRLESLVIVWVWLYTIQLTATSTMNFKTRAATEETWVCYKFRKNRRFQDSVKSTLPLLASSMFMADLSMRIISHLYILGEDTGQMTEKYSETAQNWQSQDIYRQRSISHPNWSYCFLWKSVVFLVWNRGLVWCLFFPSEAQWVNSPVKTFSKWRCCLWLVLCLQHGHHQLMVTESLPRWVSTSAFKPKHHSHASTVIPGLVYVTGFNTRKPPIVFQKRFMDTKTIKRRLTLYQFLK